jgi:hypothetical protein
MRVGKLERVELKSDAPVQAGSFLRPVSLNQSYHPEPLYPIKGVHNLVPIECGPGDVARFG